MLTRSLPAVMTEFVAERYDRRGLCALVLLIVVGGAVGYRWSDLVDQNGALDGLLLGTWALMAALLAWDVSAERDVVLLAVGLCGGGVIEWWGTNTQLWTYFTAERPPLWILPAWPIAALTIDRLTRLLDRLLAEVEARRGALAPRAFTIAHHVLLPGFVLAMVRFAWPTTSLGATRVVIALMVVIALQAPAPRRDVLTFVAGSLLGVLIEYWGTSRQCWTYYTHQIPPLEAVFAHGFASVAFMRGAALVHGVLGRLGVPFGTARRA